MEPVWVIQRKAKVPTFPGDHQWRPWHAKGLFQSKEEAESVCVIVRKPAKDPDEGDFGAIYRLRVRKYLPAPAKKKLKRR